MYSGTNKIVAKMIGTVNMYATFPPTPGSFALFQPYHAPARASTSVDASPHQMPSHAYVPSATRMIVTIPRTAAKISA